MVHTQSTNYLLSVDTLYEVNEAKLQTYTTQKKLQEQPTENQQLREQLEQKTDALLSYEREQKQQQIQQQQQQKQQQ